VSLATEVLVGWAPILRGVELKTGSTGRFEVSLDGELLFSKLQLKRHANPGEVMAAFERHLGRPLAWRKAE
jgi:selT/selW/selH-like putative selenoprotein